VDWVWISKIVALAVHGEQIAEHGGQAGVRDEGLLESALSRPLNKEGYENTEVADSAAAYAYGLTKNHPFFDGNKRTAFVVMALFLELNGYELIADDVSCLGSFLSLADGNFTEENLANWLKGNISSITD
jgi:death on curing protein